MDPRTSKRAQPGDPEAALPAQRHAPAPPVGHPLQTCSRPRAELEGNSGSRRSSSWESHHKPRKKISARLHQLQGRTQKQQVEAKDPRNDIGRQCVANCVPIGFGSPWAAGNGP